ncbi:MAG: DUF3761 domain-containing protein [Sphingomonas sp.]
MRHRRLLAFAFLALSAPSSSHSISGAASAARLPGTCGIDFYLNAHGNCVHRPVHESRAPRGATAKCRDGTYSFSQSRRGTCSWHGGVAVWL